MTIIFNLETGTHQDVLDATSNQNMARRMQEYNVGQQLNLLYDDIQAGVFGEAAKTGRFVAFLSEIKSRLPVTKVEVE
jgi:hypothetical protein